MAGTPFLDLSSQEQEVGGAHQLSSQQAACDFCKTFGASSGEPASQVLPSPLPTVPLGVTVQEPRAHRCGCVPLTETAGLDWAAEEFESLSL